MSVLSRCLHYTKGNFHIWPNSALQRQQLQLSRPYTPMFNFGPNVSRWESLKLPENCRHGHGHILSTQHTQIPQMVHQGARMLTARNAIDTSHGFLKRRQRDKPQYILNETAETHPERETID